MTACQQCGIDPTVIRQEAELAEMAAWIDAQEQLQDQVNRVRALADDLDGHVGGWDADIAQAIRGALDGEQP